MSKHEKLFEELKPFETPDFTVIERDLTDTLRGAPTAENRRIDYDTETQREKGGVIVPVCRPQRLRLTQPTPILDYTLTPLGNGVWKLQTEWGKRKLNPVDTFYTKDDTTKKIRYFIYRKEQRCFIFTENKANALKKASVIETYKQDDRIQDVLNLFETSLFPRINNRCGDVHSAYNLDLAFGHLETIRLYHYILLTIFNLIDHKTYSLISKALDSFSLNQTKAPHLNQWLFDRSIWVDKEKKTLHPSIGELQFGNQPSVKFRTKNDKALLRQFLLHHSSWQSKEDLELIYLYRQGMDTVFEEFKKPGME
ncbi:MAG: hypothetical protein ACQEWE_21590 [Bacillota bacterium]